LRPLEPWFAAAFALALAVGGGVLLTELMMAPAGDELGKMAAYLAAAGAVTLAGGWLGVEVFERVPGLSIRAKTFAGGVTGIAVALLNVLIVAQLMFVSTAHDLKVLMVLLAFSGAITTCFALWVASTTSRRIGGVAGAIGALAAGDYETRVDVRGSDEVARLSAAVNELAGRLDAASRQRDAIDAERRDLTAAISHDLRTPLASIRAMIDALDDQVIDDPAEVLRYHGALRRELDRLNGMISDLFELARIDAGAVKLDRRPIALQEIAAEVVDAMQAQARRSGIDLALSAPDDPDPVLVDGERVERAIANLVQNALQHTPAGGRVDVRVISTNGHVELAVADSGCGIADEDAPHVWQRFYRADRSRTRSGDGDGAGLGLAIVRAIVEAHGGSVDVRSSPGAGATFAIRLPR
jgi:signal transduction histidine kinase